MGTMLYKKGEEILANNLWKCDTIVADTEEEVESLLKDGWYKTPFEACVPEKDREKALSDITKKSKKDAEANVRDFRARGLDATGTWRLDDE